MPQRRWSTSGVVCSQSPPGALWAATSWPQAPPRGHPDRDFSPGHRGRRRPNHQRHGAMMAYDPAYVRDYYDRYGEREWERFELTPANRVYGNEK